MDFVGDRRKTYDAVYSLHERTIRASVDALCRDGTREISRDPRTKCLPTQWGRLAML